MYGNIFDSIDLINRGIEVTWLRNEVISNNIANIDTPGFKASEVEFEHIFSDALNNILPTHDDGLAITNEKHIGASSSRLATTHEGHIAIGGSKEPSPVVVTNVDDSVRYDENNVDLEHEMAELAKNTIEYYALISKVNSEFAKLNTAINVT